VCVCACVSVVQKDVTAVRTYHGGIVWQTVHVPWRAKREPIFCEKCENDAIFALSRTVATKIAPERPCGAVFAYHGRNLAKHFLHH
jgi:TPP-dependent indolepyruvate ferredoxin oxidoreductase alpha subunit